MRPLSYLQNLSGDRTIHKYIYIPGGPHHPYRAIFSKSMGGGDLTFGGVLQDGDNVLFEISKTPHRRPEGGVLGGSWSLFRNFQIGRGNFYCCLRKSSTSGVV